MSFEGFSEEEIEQFRRIFELSDINNDGVLDKREALRGLKGLGYKPAGLMAALNKADVNGDGVISFEEFVNAISALKKAHGFSPQEIELFRQVYESCDKDRNGTLDANELIKAFKDLGYSPSTSTNALELADKNKDGVIDFDEFLGALWNLKAKNHGFPPDRVAMWRRKFNSWDVNKDGTLDKQEIEASLTEMGFQSGSVDRILAQADKNGDGVIDFEEFLSALWQNQKSSSNVRSNSLSPQEIAFYRKVFESCDTNGNGSLDRKEAASAFTRLGLRSSLRSLFNKFDRNGDGVIGFDEFLSAVSMSKPKSPARRQRRDLNNRAGTSTRALKKNGPHLLVIVKLFPRNGFLSAL